MYLYKLSLNILGPNLLQINISLFLMFYVFLLFFLCWKIFSRSSKFQAPYWLWKYRDGYRGCPQGLRPRKKDSMEQISYSRGSKCCTG
jgi:hypothetical protein